MSVLKSDGTDRDRRIIKAVERVRREMLQLTASSTKSKNSETKPASITIFPGQ